MSARLPALQRWLLASDRDALMLRCLTVIQDALVHETPLNETLIAQRLGYRSAVHIHWVWRSNPRVWKIILDYMQLMSQKHEREVRKKAKENEKERERRRLHEVQVAYVAQHYGSRYAQQLHAGQSRL